jgi:hypothetical protein
MDKQKRLSMQQSIKAHLMHARHDPQQITAKARAAFLDSFEKKADPSGSLPPAERRRRADHLRQAHMKALALKSAEARAKRAGR